MARMTRVQLRTLAREASDAGANAEPNSYDRGYALGVEDMALLVADADPVIGERLVAILRDAGMGEFVPPTYR